MVTFSLRAHACTRGHRLLRLWIHEFTLAGENLRGHRFKTDCTNLVRLDIDVGRTVTNHSFEIYKCTQRTICAPAVLTCKRLDGHG